MMEEVNHSAEVSEHLTAIYTWLREPDWIEEASLAWLMDWMNRRPITELGMVTMLMPGLFAATPRTPA